MKKTVKTFVTIAGFILFYGFPVQSQETSTSPEKSGIVPIGATPAQTANAGAPMSASGSVVSPDQPAKMDYTNADPKDYQDDFGAREGFVFRTATGVAYQQPLSGGCSNGLWGDGNPSQNKIVFQPGIRFDLEPTYNVTDWFRVGLETAFIYNQIHSVSTEGAMLYQGDAVFGNGGYYQIPVLANISFHLSLIHI